MVTWLSGNTMVSINAVTLRQAWLILGRVTVCEWVASQLAQLFEIFEYLPSPISYLFNEMTPIFHPSNLQNQHYATLWLTKY